MKEAPYEVHINPIRFDTRLMPMARFLYGEICANITTRHGCPLNDEYFAELWDVTTRQVKKWRAELIEYGYIYIKTDTVTGLKYIFPTNTVEENIVSHNALKKPKMIDVQYKLGDGRILKDENEAKLYFQAIINSKNLPEASRNKVSMFINTFLTCIFDISYLGKKYAGSFISTKEFFEFVLQNLTVEEIYSKAMYVYDDSTFPLVRQPDYYILACISDAYKEEYTSNIKHIYMKEKRKEKKDERD